MGDRVNICGGTRCPGHTTIANAWLRWGTSLPQAVVLAPVAFINHDLHPMPRMDNSAGAFQAGRHAVRCLSGPARWHRQSVRLRLRKLAGEHPVSRRSLPPAGRTATTLPTFALRHRHS